MAERYPGYDVLAKRTTPSWNAQTRRVVDQRLAVPREPRFFNKAEFRTLDAIAARITPQPATRPPIPVAALIAIRCYSIVMPTAVRLSFWLATGGSSMSWRGQTPEALT